MNNPFDYVPAAECEHAFRKLCSGVEALKRSGQPDAVAFSRELDEGKMLGVLIAEDSDGCRHTLCAFSGQWGDGGFHFPGFVGPVFDYLQPDGHFKAHEADIVGQNAEIARFEAEDLAKEKTEYSRAEKNLNVEVARLKERYRLSKLGRQASREAGVSDEAELQAMVRQSQFEKAELHRLKKRVAADLQPYADRLREAESRLNAMKEKRRCDCEALQKWLFDNFSVLNAHGVSRSLSEIFADTPMAIPPSGAGECCAPKLLQAAYLQGWKPVCMAEYWYGKPKGGEVRLHGRHYPACRGKCLPVLSWMLQGLEVHPPLSDDGLSRTLEEPTILFENRWFCIVDKPSGMLSVPGKGDYVSVQEWLEERYGEERQVKLTHRLDQDTSGLLVASFGPVAFKVMQRMFAMRMVRKTYVAELEGDFRLRGIPREGRIGLPISPDWLDRPRQRVDHKEGKDTVTDYDFIGVADGRSRVEFHPLTGRTHQLRVHAASPEGLCMPIVGDRLYGRNVGDGSERLLLHAHRLEFSFPIDRELYSFESPVPF